MNIGKAIRQCRQARNFTQDELANNLNITKSYLSLIENNKRDISLSLTEDIAKALSVPMHILIFLSLDKAETTELSDNLQKELNQLIVDILHESN